ncbi:MAG: septum site-determining protein MinC [Clostridia bacterium]|nr:septum site-determining protein MinC [Clostridia bacterium]
MAASRGISVRSTRAGVWIRLDEEEDLADLRRRLVERIERSGLVLRGSGVTLDVGRRSLDGRQIAELEELFRLRWGVHFLQIVNGAAGRELQLDRRAEEPPAAPQGAPAAALALPAGGAERAERPATVIKRTLRSGQAVHRQGDVIVLGDVHAGAEVVATGDVIVMGVLRGVAHAGARGDESARIAAFRLRAVQLRIGSVIGRAPDGGDELPATPEVARVREGRIVIEPLSPEALWTGNPRNLHE